jgi:hypothetical protein
MSEEVRAAIDALFATLYDGTPDEDSIRQLDMIVARLEELEARG